jgi:TolA-binding protein
MNFKIKIFKHIDSALYLAAIILTIVVGCGAPKLDEDFLKEETDTSGSDNFIAQDIADSSVIRRIDSLNIEISGLESLFKKISDKDLGSRMDSILREISEIKRSISSSMQKDLTKLDSLEKESLTHSNRIKELEKKIKNISERKGVALPQKNEVKNSFDRAPSNEINTFDDFNTNYDYAITLYNNKKYDEAANIFGSLLNSRLRKPDLIDNIYFWLGECAFQKNNFNDAINNFKNVLSQPKANKAEDALWKLGLTNEKTNHIEEAREYFQRLIDSFPKSRYINRAKAKLKTLI